jgi:hypothetical protein
MTQDQQQHDQQGAQPGHEKPESPHQHPSDQEGAERKDGEYSGDEVGSNDGGSRRSDGNTESAAGVGGSPLSEGAGTEDSGRHSSVSHKGRGAT